MPLTRGLRSIMIRRVAIGGRCVAAAWASQRRLISMAPLHELKGSTGAQQWLQALEKAPCLVCGAAPLAAHRVDCAVSGFPLTCSSECNEAAEAEHHEQLQIFQQIHEDLQYAASLEARTLLTNVITRNQRARGRGEDKAKAQAKSWEEFARLFTQDSQWLESPQAVRLISAAYSFVATLSQYLSVLGADGPNANLHVVGARAEAMMPRHIWEELVDGHETTNFAIKLIGDHVPPLSRKKVANAMPSNLQFDFIPGFYHDVVQTSPALSQPPDAFVLYHPGIGHPKLREAWRPTMEMILRSGKPVLLTAFSQRDQARDVSALEALDNVADIQFLLDPQENVFRNRCFHLDPIDVFAPIQANSHVMIVRGSPKQ